MPVQKRIACEDCGKEFKSYYILILHARYHRKESNYIFQRHSASLQNNAPPEAIESEISADNGHQTNNQLASQDNRDHEIEGLESLGSPGAEEPPTIFGQLSCSPPHLPNPVVGSGDGENDEEGENSEPRLVYMTEEELRRRPHQQQRYSNHEQMDDDDEDEEEVQELECEICDARFQQVLELLKHIRIHRYELTESNYQQYRRKIVTTHRPAGVRVDLRRFPDDAGVSAPATASQQKSTAAASSNGTEYECDYCGKRFPTASNLKRHIPVHTGERPHQCPFCGCRFGDRSYMLKHTRFVHNVELARVQKSKSKSRSAKGSFKCQICDKYFENGDILAVHLEKYHSRPGKVSRPADSGVEDEYPEEEEEEEDDEGVEHVVEQQQQEDDEELLIDAGLSDPAQPQSLYSCDPYQLQAQMQEHEQQQQLMADAKPKLTVKIADA